MNSFKCLIVRYGLDVCVVNVFQSSITVLGINEYTPEVIESALTRSKIWRLHPSVQIKKAVRCYYSKITRSPDL